MTRTRAYLVVITLFLLGVMVGILATHAFYAHRMHRPGGLVELAMGVLAADLRRSLDLDPQQQAEVDLILADTTRDLVEIRTEVIQRIRDARSSSFERLVKVLRADQRVELERFRARQSSRLERLVGEPLDQPLDPTHDGPTPEPEKVPTTSRDAAEPEATERK